MKVGGHVHAAGRRAPTKRRAGPVRLRRVCGVALAEPSLAHKPQRPRSQDNARIFKCIKAVRNRRVVWREGDRQLVEVEQLGQWRFLWFHGTFVTKLRVEEDRRSHSVRWPGGGVCGRLLGARTEAAVLPAIK